MQATKDSPDRVMSMDTEQKQIYGLMAEFEEPEKLQWAARRTYAAGYRKIDAYSPFPIEGLAENMGRGRTWISLLVLGGGLSGAVGGFLMQWYATVISYPLNVGGKPLNAWPAYIPITFELTILLAAFAAFGSIIVLNGLPQPYHPVFNVPEFEKASRDGFFLAIESADPKFDRQKTEQFLANLGATKISEIEY